MIRGLAQYQRFIDLMVDQTSSVGASRARRGVWNGNLLPGQPYAEKYQQELPDQAAYQRLLDQLSPEQREVLAMMLEHERESAIFDVLVAMTVAHIRLSRNGARLPVKPYGNTLFWDYGARRDGDEWPSDVDAIP